MAQVSKLKDKLADVINNTEIKFFHTNEFKPTPKQQTNLLSSMVNFLIRGDFNSVYFAVDNNDKNIIAVSNYYMTAAFLANVPNISIIEDIGQRYMWSKLMHISKDKSSPRLLIIDEDTYISMEKFYSSKTIAQLKFREFLLTIANFTAIIILYGAEDTIIADFIVQKKHAELAVAYERIHKAMNEKRRLPIFPGEVYHHTTNMVHIINTRYQKGGYIIMKESHTEAHIVGEAMKIKRLLKNKKPINILSSVNQSAMYILGIVALLDERNIHIGDNLKSNFNMAVASHVAISLSKKDLHLTNRLSTSTLMYSSRAHNVRKNLFGLLVYGVHKLLNICYFLLYQASGNRIMLTTDLPVLRSKYNHLRKKLFIPVTIGMDHIMNEQTKKLKEALSMWSILHEEFYYLEDIVVILDEDLVEVGFKISPTFQKVLNNKQVNLRDISKQITKFLIEKLDVDKMIHVKLITSKVRKVKGVPIPMLSQ